MTSPRPNIEPGRPVVVLVGLPGSGKSSVGRLLAKRWSVGFRDTDNDIEEVTGRSVGDIFVESGETFFRELERVAVAEALHEHSGVLALGGGAVADDATRALLRTVRVVFLDVGLADAMKRLEMNRSRPLLLGNIRAQWQALADARRPWYEQVADHVVVTDGESVDAVVDQIAGHWTDQSWRKTP